jgi:hypothetical protein
LIKTPQFEYNLNLLYSIDNRQIIVGLQNIFFDLAAGLILTPGSKKNLEDALKIIILKNEDAEARRYAYTVGAFFLSKELSDICREQISAETDPENISWAFALLSTNTKDPHEFDKVKKSGYPISDDAIKLISYLFRNTDLGEKDISRIILKNDPLSMRWVGWIEICEGFKKRRDKKKLYLDKGIVSDLSTHNDTEIAKRIVASLWLKNTFSIKDTKIDPIKYLSHDDKLKKWFFTAIWEDRRMIVSNNHEYIREILSLRHLFGPNCSTKTREGIARGLSGYIYDKHIATNILEWITNENNPSTKDFLLKYIIKHQHYSNDFKQVTNETLNNDETKRLLRSTLTNKQLDIYEKKKSSFFIGEKNMKDNKDQKDGAIFINVGQINMASDRAVIKADQAGAIGTIDVLIKELERTPDKFKDDIDYLISSHCCPV